MSYRCENCGNVHYGKQNKVITEIREVNYNHYYNRKLRDGNIKMVPIGGSTGTEIVKEERYCDPCFSVMGDNEPKVVKTKESSVLKPKPKFNVDYSSKKVYNSFEDLADNYR